MCDGDDIGYGCSGNEDGCCCSGNGDRYLKRSKDTGPGGMVVVMDTSVVVLEVYYKCAVEGNGYDFYGNRGKYGYNGIVGGC